MAVGMGRGMLPGMVNENLDSIAGGTVGVGAPVVLRETADVRGGEPISLLGAPGSALARATRPSVAWGVGVGSLTGALWWMDVGGKALQDFYLAHTVTGIPTGLASALMPKQVGSGSAGEQVVRSLSELRPGSTGSPNNGESQSSDEFAPADGTSPDTQPAN